LACTPQCKSHILFKQVFMRKLLVTRKLWITSGKLTFGLLLVVFFCSFNGISTGFGQTVELTRVENLTVIGERFANVFLSEKGDQIEEEITKEEYQSLSIKNSKQPISKENTNYQYLSSYGGQPITTPTILKDNEYYDLLPVKINDSDATGTEMIMMKFPGLQPSEQQKKNFFDEIISWIKSEFSIPTAYASIAVENNSEGTGNNVTSITFAHTIAGTNPILIVHCATAGGNGDHLTGITYNGDAMALQEKVLDSADYYSYMYALKNPDTGTNNIVVSLSAGDYPRCVAESYTGADITTNPTDTSQDTGAIGNTTFKLQATSTVADSWMITGVYNSGQADTTAGANTTLRNSMSSYLYENLFDSAGALASVGANTHNFSATGGRWGGASVIIAPYAATSTPPTATTTIESDGIEYNNELTMITGYEEIYTTSTTTPSEIRRSWYHVPFLAWVVLGVPTLWIFGRFILELIIRMRLK